MCNTLFCPQFKNTINVCFIAKFIRSKTRLKFLSYWSKWYTTSIPLRISVYLMSKPINKWKLLTDAQFICNKKCNWRAHDTVMLSRTIADALLYNMFTYMCYNSILNIIPKPNFNWGQNCVCFIDSNPIVYCKFVVLFSFPTCQLPLICISIEQDTTHPYFKNYKCTHWFLYLFTTKSVSLSTFVDISCAKCNNSKMLNIQVKAQNPFSFDTRMKYRMNNRFSLW